MKSLLLRWKAIYCQFPSLIKGNGDVLCPGTSKNRLYFMEIKVRKGHASLAGERASGVDLRNLRFEHGNKAMIHEMSYNNKVRGLYMKVKSLHEVTCPTCSMRKQFKLTLAPRSNVPRKLGEYCYQMFVGD